VSPDYPGIDYVTPEQCHQGLRVQIIAERKAKLKKQQILRKEVNRLGQIILTQNEKTVFSRNNLIMSCSVIIS